MQLNLQGESSWHKNKNSENKIWQRNLHCIFVSKKISSNIVRDVLKSVVVQVVTKTRNETKLTTDYQMKTETLQLWPKDEAFQFWNKSAKRSVSWIEIDAKKRNIYMLHL